MPKLKETPVQRMERVFRAAVFYGLERKRLTTWQSGRRMPGQLHIAESGYQGPVPLKRDYFISPSF